ncbi:Uncharacterised protein [uncultured archaeon]|nr:Uncharacterised protein [uncultured archaeon]
MLSFQIYASKEDEDDDRKESPLGAKARKKKELLDAHANGEALFSGDAQEIAANISEIEKSFRKHGLSEFISTLTPGAQNAIYAASFAWGFENAAKSVKNTMTLEEVKRAADPEEKSKVVIESLQKQFQNTEGAEKTKEVSKFVWGFYNEDMKETQATSSKSESITERDKEKESPERVPLSATEAVTMGIIQNSHNPAMQYCVGAAQEAESSEHLQIEAQKKEELAKLVSAQEMHAEKEAGKTIEAQQANEKEKEKIAEAEKEKAKEAVLEKEAQKAAEEGPKLIIQEQEKERQKSIKMPPAEKEKEAVDSVVIARIKEEEKAMGAAAQKISSEAVALAIQRRQELVKEYVKVETELLSALDKLDSMAKEEKFQVKKFAAMLPRELSRYVLSREKLFSKRTVLRKQLVKWIAFCRDGRGSISRMPLNRLIKMISLSNLFR